MTSRFPRLLLALLMLPARGSAQPRMELQELHMGVRVRMVVYAESTTAVNAARAAFDAMAALEERMSDYRATSEVRQLELHPGEAVHVSRELFEVLARAREVAAATEGAFDPTVAPIIALWREARRRHRLPDPAALDSARRLVNWKELVLDSTARTVRLERAGMRVDLGGIAKGYIIQAALDTLRARGITRVLIEAGGDIAVGDPPPASTGWNIETPAADSAIAARARVLRHAAISTSGPTAQYMEIEGTRYSHVVDPRTGQALTTPYLATVVGPDAAVVDALSTALTILPPERRAVVLARYPAVIASVHVPPP